MLIRLITNALRGQFVRNAMTLMLGTGVAQLIAVATSPIIARLYTPEAFGGFALYLSWVTILSTLAAARYDFAVMLPKEDAEARHIAIGAICICACTSAAILVATLLFGDAIARALGNPSLTLWLRLSPLAILLTAGCSTLNYWHNRQNRYRMLAGSRIAQALCTSSSAIGLAGFWPAGGIFLSSLVGQSAVAVVLGRGVRPGRFRVDAPERTAIIAALRRYKSFPLVSIPNDLINLLSGHAPRFILGAFFGSSTLGFFFLTQRLLDLPLGLVAGSVRDVFNQRANELYQRDGSCRELFLKTFKHLVMLAVIPSAIIFAAAPAAFTLVFGERWHDAGVYSRILVPLYFFRFCISPLCTIFYTTQKQHWELVWQSVLLVLTCVSLFVGIKLKDVEAGLACYSAAYSVMYIIIFFMAFRLAKGEPRPAEKNIAMPGEARRLEP